MSEKTIYSVITDALEAEYGAEVPAKDLMFALAGMVVALARQSSNPKACLEWVTISMHEELKDVNDGE